MQHMFFTLLLLDAILVLDGVRSGNKEVGKCISLLPFRIAKFLTTDWTILTDKRLDRCAPDLWHRALCSFGRALATSAQLNLEWLIRFAARGQGVRGFRDSGSLSKPCSVPLADAEHTRRRPLGPGDSVEVGYAASGLTVPGPCLGGVKFDEEKPSRMHGRLTLVRSSWPEIDHVGFPVAPCARTVRRYTDNDDSQTYWLITQYSRWVGKGHFVLDRHHVTPNEPQMAACRIGPWLFRMTFSTPSGQSRLTAYDSSSRVPLILFLTCRHSH